MKGTGWTPTAGSRVRMIGPDGSLAPQRPREEPTVSHVAIVTDSASDLPADVAASAGIAIVPLVVSFGAEIFRPNIDLTTDAFWERMVAPNAPFPTTAAASPGDFLAAYDAALSA